ncbi:MAG TPA: hypothetical protein VHY09_15785 [Candidatus Methylacidiphilales bacterium]|nr:hypothetical protein [Candidatus Methylacidiphilales bacterium]
MKAQPGEILPGYHFTLGRSIRLTRLIRQMLILIARNDVGLPRRRE